VNGKLVAVFRLAPSTCRDWSRYFALWCR